MNKWIIAGVCLIIGMMIGSIHNAYWEQQHREIVQESSTYFRETVIQQLNDYKQLADLYEYQLERCEYRENEYIKNLEDGYDIDLYGGYEK